MVVEVASREQASENIRDTFKSFQRRIQAVRRDVAMLNEMHH